MVSLDGYFEGLHHDLSWHHVDREFNTYAIQQAKNVGTLLFGKRTYELMRDYWPTAHARKDDPVVARLMNTTPKVVVSTTLGKEAAIPHWEHVSVIHAGILESIQNLKNQKGKEIGVYGSNMLAVSLLKAKLLDEIRIMVNPVAIGSGTPLFAGMHTTCAFILVGTKPFKSGNVLLTYKPIY